MSTNLRTTGKSKITEYELSSDKKSVISSKETVVNQSSTVQRSVSGPLGEIEDELIFAPAMPVKSFSTVIEMTIDIFESSGKYTVSYRKVGVGEWTLVEKGTVNIFPSFETEYVKTVNYTFPSNDFYEIKIERQDSKTFNIQELNAYYDEIVATDVTEVIKTLEYDTNHPGNVVAVNTHQIVSGSPSSVLPSVESRTTYQYDSAYNADLVKESTTVTDVEGIQSVISTEAQYDRLGRITSVTRQSSQDLSSSQTSMEYDLLGRLTKVINPSHDDTTNTSYVSYAYLDTQRKIRITDELGTVREETYDGMDRLITSSWIDSNQSKIISHNRYDSVGDLVSSFDGKFNETKYEYDAFGRNTKVIYPDLTYTTTQYSEVYTDPLAVPSLWFEAPSVISGLPLDGWIRVFGAAGESVYYGYDILGRTVVTASNPNSSPQNGSLRWSFVWHEYDRYDRITKTAVQRQQNVWDTTEYGYRYPISAPSSIDLPGDTEPIHVYEYNSKGLMTKEYDVNTVNITSYQYDELGRLKRIDYPNNITAKYKSDKFGNTISAQLLKNGITESVVTFDYNKRNWLESQQWTIGTNSYTISHEYDAAGNRKKTVYPDNVEVSFDYDQLGRIVKIPGLFESADSVNIQNKGFVYDDAGNLLNTYAANGINTMYSYNTKNNVTNISSTPLTLSYSYNNSGNVISVVDSTTGMTPMTLQYTYDKAGQLKTAQVIRDNAVQTLSYWYDGAGNRIYETLTDTANQLLSSYQYSYLPGNYLSQKTGQSNLSYTWGQFGQLTYKSTGEQYVYDSTKSLISVQNGATQTTNYKYDALGNRIQITENGTTTTVLTSGNDSVYEIVAPSAGDVTTSKYITVNGKHLAKIIKEGSQEAEAFFHHIDLTGSIRAVTDSEGQVVKRYEYDPFGYVSRSSGSGEETHQFTGKRADTGTGLTYFGSRYYDPEIGRFISSDPARWGTNWYVYCYNNPISYIDPNGMKPENASAVLQQSKYTTQYDTYKFAREGYITVTGIVASVLTLDSSTIGDVARKMGWLVLTSLYVEDFYDDISVNNTNPYLVDPLQYVRFLEEAEVLYNQYVKQAETIRATLDVMYEENFLDYETMKIMREMMVEAETNANQLAIEIEANFNALEQLRQDSFGMWTGR